MYEEVLSQALLITPEEQAHLIEDLAAHLRQYLDDRPHHSITELRGLGKELWQGIDVEKYIEEERSSW